MSSIWNTWYTCLCSVPNVRFVYGWAIFWHDWDTCSKYTGCVPFVWSIIPWPIFCSSWPSRLLAFVGISDTSWISVTGKWDTSQTLFIVSHLSHLYMVKPYFRTEWDICSGCVLCVNGMFPKVLKTVPFVPFCFFIPWPECLSERPKKSLKYPYGACTHGHLTRVARKIAKNAGSPGKGESVAESGGRHGIPPQTPPAVPFP